MIWKIAIYKNLKIIKISSLITRSFTVITYDGEEDEKDGEKKGISLRGNLIIKKQL